MPVKKWSPAQRAKFSATVAARKKDGSERGLSRPGLDAIDRAWGRSSGKTRPRITRMPRHVYVLRNGQFFKVRLQRVRAVTLGEIS